MIKNILKFLISTVIAFSVLLPVATADVINTLDQFTATTSPSAAITQRVFGKALRITGLTNGLTLCLDANGIVTTSGCSSSGGGSGGGTWSTTTSQVSGQLINYPNNATNIITAGGTATTSAKFWIDPNLSIGQLGNGTCTYTDPTFIICRTITQAIASASHGFVNQDVATNGLSYAGFDFQTQVGGAANMSGKHVAPFQSNGQHIGGQELGDWFSFTNTFTNTSGVLDRFYGLKVNDPDEQSAIGEEYGVWIGSMQGATSTNRYQLYTSGTSGKSKISSSLIIGGADGVSSNAPLTVFASTTAGRAWSVKSTTGVEIAALFQNATDDGALLLWDHNGNQTIQLRAAGTAPSFFNTTLGTVFGNTTMTGGYTVEDQGTLHVTGYVDAQRFVATSSIASSLPYASTTALSVSGLTSGNCVQAGTNGLLTTVGSACGSGGGAFSWTTTSNFNQTTNATTTAIWTQATPISLMASSTSEFDSATSTYFETKNNTFLATAGGNVGIGSSSPLFKLSLDGLTGSDVIGIRNTSGAVVTNDIVTSIQTYTKDASNITNRNTSYINTVDDQVDYAGIAAPTRIEFGTQSTAGGAPTTKLTVGNTNVGIGTSTPLALLHVVSTITTADTLRLQYDNLGNGGNWGIDPFISGISNGGLSFVDKQNVITPLVISNGGFLGSGTTTPRVQLSASATGFNQIEAWGQTASQAGAFRAVNDAGATGRFGVFGSAFGTANLQNHTFIASDGSTHDIIFGFGNLTELMRLQSSTGFLGIGSTSPNAMLSVAGSGYFTGIITATSTTNSSKFPYASTTAISAGTICLTGDTCRTTWPSGSGPFTVTGNLIQNNTGNAFGINIAPNFAAIESQGTTSDKTAYSIVGWNSNASPLFLARNDGASLFGTTTVADDNAVVTIAGTSTNPATRELVIKTFPAQTGNLFQIENIAATSLFKIQNNGAVVAASSIQGTQIVASANTCASNAFQYNNNAGTGMNFPTVNGVGAIALCTSSFQDLTLSGSGNSFGTSSPFLGTTLDIASTTNQVGFKGQLSLTDNSAPANLKHLVFTNLAQNLWITPSNDVFATTSVPLLSLLANGNAGFGTSSPIATTSIQSNSSVGDAFVIATSSAATIAGYDNDGHRFTSGPAPTISSCGMGSPTVTGDDQTGTITTGTAATSCTMTFAKAYRQIPVCNFNDDSSTIPGDISSVSASAVTFALGAGLSGGHLYYSCEYHR